MNKLINKLTNKINEYFDNITFSFFGMKVDDSVKHITLSFIINTILFLIFLIWIEAGFSLFLSNLITLLIGFYKEKRDKETTGFSKKDIFFNLFGVFLSDLVIILFI